MTTDPIRAALERLLLNIQELANSSEGVTGLHLNGDIASWSDLLEGDFSAWLGDAIAAAHDALAAAADPDPAAGGEALLATAKYAPLEGKGGELVCWLRSTAEWQSLLSDEGYARLTRAVLTRWGRPAAPPAPPEGEVGELVAALRRIAPQNPMGINDPTILRAATLLEQLATAAPPAPLEREPSDKDFLRVAEYAAHIDRDGIFDALEEGYPLELTAIDILEICRAVYRLGRPAAPAAPADREVGELVAKLRRLAPQNPLGSTDPTILRAATLLEKQAAELAVLRAGVMPVAVSERLPEPNVKVLAHYFNALAKGRTVCAIWVPAKSRSNDDGLADEDFAEYDEEDDKYYWPEGWYEAIENWDDLGWVKIDEGEVVYWQPLPKWPSHAISLPSPQGEEVV
jgi:hypothetical protein